jgi:phage terminase Nu1 subunit (DNA packaging protein)
MSGELSQQQQIDELYGLLGALHEELKQSGVNSNSALINDHAFRLALVDLGKEIAERSGIPATLFQKRFQNLVGWHADELLRTMSGAMPGYVSSLDTRTAEQIPTDVEAPRLLDPPLQSELE